VIDIGRDEKGKRQQITRTFDKLKEARADLSRIRHETDQGTYVKPSEITVNEYLDEYLVGATRGRSESTKVSYRDAFCPVRERLGVRALQSVSKADVENPAGLDAHVRPQAGRQGWYGPRTLTCVSWLLLAENRPVPPAQVLWGVKPEHPVGPATEPRRKDSQKEPKKSQRGQTPSDAHGQSATSTAGRWLVRRHWAT
jgi:hypothetical protein